MAHIEHNLSDFELIEVLEKSLKSAQKAASGSERLKDPQMIAMADRWKGMFAGQMKHMMERIEGVLKNAD